MATEIPKPFPTRVLGNSGVQVSALGLGCMGMSEFYGSTNDDESIKVLNESIDRGCTFWDTADIYGNGKNEELLSKVLKSRRNEVFLATKFGNVRNEKGEFLGISGKPDYIRQCLEASLKRLGVDHVDLYYQHRIDRDTPIEETVKTLSELVKEGKAKYIGLSECSADTLRRAHKVHPIACVQMEYSPWTTDIERNGLLEAARELNVAIVPYSPLGRRFLTGRYKSPEDFEETDFRRYMPRFQGENFAKNYTLVEKIAELANQKGVSPAQLTLAWVLAQGDDFIPIPGTRKVNYLLENLASASIKLSKDDDKAIRDIINSIDIQGERYQKAQMNNINV
jgi:aryl-alcohol dehydrogenase-like predicted oxidoreductase